ncbi:MAG: formate dehydrogenase accessory sulfurtransferase FdhD [Desulfobacteraceae bacterium]|nr:formate dehydrogenase accessory sulfurtransferase FdhD [Desulfobacteraceae bacterium]
MTEKPRPVLHWDPQYLAKRDFPVVKEEPLSIRIQGNPYSVIMRTPGDEIAHAAGFCLAEGIVDSHADIHSIGYCDDVDTNVVTITLSPAKRAALSPEVLERRGFISQTSCGICGKSVVAELYRHIAFVRDEAVIDPQKAWDLIESLGDYQPMRRQTKASHGTVIMDAEFNCLSSAEDVGRHNALDKAIGKLLLSDNLHRAKIAALSSRVSYELVQKTARAAIPIVLSVSRPTSLAIELAEQLNVSLACLAPDTGLLIFCHPQRFQTD